jgi:hypothetical protein
MELEMFLGTGLITNTEFNYLNGITSTVVGISTSQTLTNKIISSGTNTIGANELRTTGSSVVIDTASPPTTGQVLKATSATTATWQTPSSGGGAGTVVYVNGGTFTISTEPHNTTFLLDSNVAITLPSLTGIDGFIYNFVSATLEIAPTWTITTSDGILYSSITEVGNETGNATTLTASSSNNVSYRTVTLMALNTTFQWVCIGTAFGWSGSGGGGGGGG